MAIETLYDRMGGMGRFQWMTSLLIALCQVPAGWSMLQMTFAGVVPDFFCIVGGDWGGNDGGDVEHRNETGAAGIDTGMSKYHLNQTLNKCSVNGSSCDRYLYDTSLETVITEWGLVCDLKWVKKVIISIQMLGVLTGAIIAGQCSDFFGRKRVLYSFACVHFFLNIIAGFSTSWIMFSILRFFLGMCMGAIIVVKTPFQMEFLPVKWRPLIGAFPCFTLGLSIFAGAAAWMENWANLHFACALLSLLSLFGGFFIPESPRWLVVHDRIEDAEDVIKMIERVNRKPVPPNTLNILKKMIEKTKSTEKLHRYTYINLFKKKFSAKVSLVFFYFWFVLATVYYGISFGVGSLVGSLYLNIFLLGVLEIPVLTTTFFLNNCAGRRKTTLLFLVLCFLSLLGCLLCNELAEGSMKGVSINVLSLIAKMTISAAWSSIEVWGTELFPTVMRNLGCGFSTLGARVGGILAPFVIDFDEMMSLSYGILCILLAFSGVLAFVVPETKDKVLKDQLKKEMESVAEDESEEMETRNLSDEADLQNGKCDFGNGAIILDNSDKYKV